MSSRSRMRERDLLLFVFGVATHFTIQYSTINGRRVAYRHGHCEAFLLYSPLALFWGRGAGVRGRRKLHLIPKPSLPVLSPGPRSR